jgi:hypothetical protein
MMMSWKEVMIGYDIYSNIDQDLDERQKNKISNITFNFTIIKCYILLYF